MKNINIYKMSHNSYYDYSLEHIKMLQIGSENSTYDYGFKYKDNTGNNISKLYPYYGVFTGVYWIWKNTSLVNTKVGIFQSQLMLDFLPNEDKISKAKYKVFESEIPLVTSPKKYLENIYSLEIIEKFNDFNLVHLEKGEMKSSNFEFYTKTRKIESSDLDLFKSLLDDKESKVFDNYMSSNFIIPVTFLMDGDLFKYFCKNIFNLFTKLENEFCAVNYIANNLPIFEYFGEIYFNIFLDSIKNKTNPKLNKLFIELSTIELPPVMLKQNISKLNFVEKEDKKYINIFMAFNDYYSIAAAASINSIVKNSSKKNYYKLNLICDSILPKNIGAIKSILTNYPNFTLSLINAKDIYGLDLKFLKVRSYYHPSTYARLYIPTIYQNIDKCIYIDVDTIITVDIATLYNIDISDNYIAGVRDFGILAEENLYNKKLISKNIDKFNRAQYTKDTLGINNLENYFQASVLILNLKEIRKDKLELQLIQEIGKGQYLYQDQDILNKVLKSKVHYLDYNWSAPCSNIKDYNTFYAALNFSDYKKYIKSFENIKIAHYLGKTKPWNFPDTIERELYLTYIKDTLLNIDDFKSNPSLAKPVKKNNATNI